MVLFTHNDQVKNVTRNYSALENLVSQAKFFERRFQFSVRGIFFEGDIKISKNKTYQILRSIWLVSHQRLQ